MGLMMLGRTVAAVIVHCDVTAPRNADVAAVLRRWAAAVECGGPEVAVVGDPEPDTIRAVLTDLAMRGIGPGLVVLVGEGDISAPSGTGTQIVRCDAGLASTLDRLLGEQVHRRRHRRVPDVDPDPAWTIRETGRDPLRHRVTETLLTLGAGGLATRGSVEEDGIGTVPMVLADGVYDGVGAEQHLLPGPDWTGVLSDPTPADDVRILDLRTGVLLRVECTAEGPALRAMRLASITRPGVVALRVEAGAGRLRPGPALRRPAGADWADGLVGDRRWAVTGAGSDGGSAPGTSGGIAALAAQRTGSDGGISTVERMACYSAQPRGRPEVDDLAERLTEAERAGFDTLLAEQRAAWAARWAAVDVRIPDDPAAERAVRFALFHLWCNVGDGPEAAVGARGLSGPAYRGHVFWDADVYVLPAVVSMQPSLARGMIEYRLRRLDEARRAAQAVGRQGARFPWESALTGEDVTPESGALGGRPVPVRTGGLEEHITADIAWAVLRYTEWSGDAAYLQGPAGALLIETARYWASRCRWDAAGHAHIDAVIGPDEYHEDVDDNAYTNVMARWNLRVAADFAESGQARAGDPPPDLPVSDGEIEAWRHLAAHLVDGYDKATGGYEQFRGYHDLESLRAADIATPPFAADVLLGRSRVAASQLVKQPDVLMLHHVVPDELEDGSLAVDLDLYGPRTAHGSSLSPAINASLLARAGEVDAALDMLRVALALDLEDLTATTASGLHLATLGGIWQAMLAGFAGVVVRGGIMRLDPLLPTAWRSLEVAFRCLGRDVRLVVRQGEVTVRTDGPVMVQLDGHGAVQVDGEVTWRR
jgi:trehalose/maltose hydrolase-like predicted phosphorylase